MKTQGVSVGLGPLQLEYLDEWRHGQLDQPNRSEAIRRLLLIAFTLKAMTFAKALGAARVRRQANTRHARLGPLSLGAAGRWTPCTSLQRLGNAWSGLGITKQLCGVFRVLVLCHTCRRCAERAEICRRHWRGYHRQRTGFVLAIEWCRL